MNDQPWPYRRPGVVRLPIGDGITKPLITVGIDCFYDPDLHSLRHFFFAKRDISAGEELPWDYGTPLGRTDANVIAPYFRKPNGEIVETQVGFR